MGRQTTFIGLEAVQKISYVTHRGEETRCYFCKNKCLRTFIDVKLMPGVTVENLVSKTSKIPIGPGIKRLIVNNSCDKGLVEDVNAMREIKKGLDSVKESNPNMAEIAAKQAFKPFNPAPISNSLPRFVVTAKQKARVAAMKRRETLRIGIPRVLNQYTCNPAFSAYFESLGIPANNLVYSDYTTEELYKAGAKRGAIDPCFPSKIAIPHVHNLLYKHHNKRPLDVIFFPMIDTLTSHLSCTQGQRACPTVTATPEAVKAAFTKEGDVFAEMGVIYKDTFVNVSDPRLLEKQLFDDWVALLGLTRAEHRRAVDEGYRCLERYRTGIRQDAREVLDRLEAEDRLGIVLLGRPYHNDPGVNHEIFAEFQRIGYPVFTQDTLPIDDDLMDRLFGED